MVLLRAAMVYSVVQAERLRKMLGGRTDVVEKQMFGGIAFLIGGNMALGVSGEDLIVRVDPSKTDALLREPGAKPFDLGPGGRAPAGWLLVAPTGHKTEGALRVWVDRGTAYASSLPKKAPKKDKSRK